MSSLNPLSSSSSLSSSTVIGVENLAFKGKDGTQVKGLTLYVTERIDPQRGQGERADRFFLSEAKLAALDFKPAPGQTIEVYYNRFGRIATVKLVDDTSDIEID